MSVLKNVWNGHVLCNCYYWVIMRLFAKAAYIDVDNSEVSVHYGHSMDTVLN